jgi:hypothetical protein
MAVLTDMHNRQAAALLRSFFSSSPFVISSLLQCKLRSVRAGKRKSKARDERG